MRDSSYLTPMAQVVVGGLVLIACIAWPPLFIVLVLIAVARFARRARRGDTLAVFVAVGLLAALTFGLMWLVPSLALIVFAVGFGVVVWVVVGRLGATRSRA
jgi:hypothetical protein